jgi:hypothetical protein
MNKQILGLLSLFVLIAALPACGKRDMKKTDKKVHHKKHNPKNKHKQMTKKTREYVETVENEDMK